MGLKIMTGRQSMQISQAVYQDIKKARENGLENLYLLVPEQFTLGAETALIEALGQEGLSDIEVLSPKRLGLRVLKETGGLNIKVLDQHGRNMLLQKAMTLVQENLIMYKSSVQKSGFSQKIGELIVELKENELLPEDFDKVLEDLPSGLLKQKLTDIRKIYWEYNQLMGNDRIDDKDLHQLFLQKIPQASFLKSSAIWIDGFQNFSSQDYRMIRNLLTTARDLAVGLSVELDESAPDASAFSLTRNTLNRLKEIGASVEADLKMVSIDEKEFSSPEICFLQKNLFAYPQSVWKKSVDKIKMFQNQNVWEEVEQGAVEILKLIRQENHDYKDIVVLTGDMDLYQNIIKGVFTQYGIPFFLDELRPIGDNHLIEAVSSALESVAYHYRHDDLMGYIKTGFSPISLEEGQDLENYVLEFGIKGFKWKTPFTKISQNPSLELEVLNSLRERVIDPLLTLESRVKGKKSYRQMTEAVYTFLVETKVNEQLDDLSQRLLEAGDFEIQSAYDQIFSRLMEVFDQLVETMGEEEVAFNEYIRLLKTAIQDYQLGVIPPHGNFVNITDLKRSRNAPFKTLLIFGMNEGKIPGTGSEPNLITDTERKTLENYQLHFQNNLAFQMEQENFLIYDVLTRPKERLFLFWALSDLEGNSLQPSLFIERILNSFELIKINSTIGKSNNRVLDHICRPEVTIWELIHFLKGNQIYSEEEAAIWQAVYNWFLKNGYQKEIERTLQATQSSEAVKRLSPEQALSLYGKKMSSSVTRLEQFRKCPFSHFVQYGLKPEERLIYEVAAPEIGILLHQVVDDFFKWAKAEDIDLHQLKEGDKEKKIAQLMEKNLPGIRTNVFNSSASYRYLGKKLERVGKRSIDHLISQLVAGDFVPFQSELVFEQPVKDLKEEFYLYGKIDRVDLYEKDQETWVKIIDYKTGKKKLSYGDIYYGLSLQLVVYMDGCLSVLKKENLVPGGILYFHVDDPVIAAKIDNSREDFKEQLQKEMNKAFSLNGLISNDASVIEAMDEAGNSSEFLPVRETIDREAFEELIEYVRELVKELVSEIYSGEIAVRPVKNKEITACTYCRFQGICQFDPEISPEAYQNIGGSMKKEEFFAAIRKEPENEQEMDS
ncbi:PD-(D/E)XK nuclease family protein [Eubacteriaceae bacterium ES3]|nr:PD-(D/E)XK nuclease family protein [Eubacteriaceae bacterium ES3]